MSESSDNSNDPAPAPSVIQSPRTNIKLRSSMLRPSLFGSKLNSNSIAEEQQSDGGGGGAAKAEDAAPKVNPFLALPEDKSLDNNGSAAGGETTEGKDEEKTNDPLSLLSKNGLPKSTLFASTKTSIPLSEGTPFVFGQNVHERVTGECVQNVHQTGDSTKMESDSSNQSSTSTNLLFSNAIQSTKACSDKNDVEKPTQDGENKSLTDVAREYEESRAQKRKYEEVETFTGEEKEMNVVDINCKLFAFVNANWEERGRGSLRLNDSKEDEEYSRVVFRTSGNLRLLINTKVWPDMVAEKAGPKSLRLTAIDNNGQVKIFLIMTRPDDINILFNALSKRIKECKNKKPEIDNGANGNETETKSTSNKNDDETENNEPSTKKPAVELN